MEEQAGLGRRSMGCAVLAAGNFFALLALVGLMASGGMLFPSDCALDISREECGAIHDAAMHRVFAAFGIIVLANVVALWVIFRKRR